MAGEIADIEHELAEAQRDLQQVVSEVNQKIEATGARTLRTDAAIVGATAAAVLGFVMGSTSDAPVIPALMMLGWLGALNMRHRRKGRHG